LWSGEQDDEGVEMATFRRPTRLIAAGSCAAALVAAPMFALLAGSGDAPRAVACPGDVNISIINEGVPIGSNCPQELAPGPQGGAPSEGMLTNCSGVPGCLSNSLYGTGGVQVPQRSTQVHQSQ
jgi:hypothetical protein